MDCPVQTVLGVWKFVREPWLRTGCRSTPGHLLHGVVEGSYTLKTNGRTHAIQPGDVIYYHESEEVEWLGGPTPVTFYSVAFLAPAWAPLPPTQRVFPASAAMRHAFRALHEADSATTPMARALGVYTNLLSLLAELERIRRVPPETPRPSSLWHELEGEVRRRKQFRASLDDLCHWGRVSKATVVRACRQSTGHSPMARLRQLRIAEAQGLLRHSMLNVSQIARYLGYPRLHEFSREFKRVAGVSPTGQRPPA